MAQLAHGLRRLDVRPGERVATFLWNTQEYLEAYFAIPCMGAVLHTLNIRLSDDEIEFIVYDAEDRVVNRRHVVLSPDRRGRHQCTDHRSGLTVPCSNSRNDFESPARSR